jgi:diguanylate cyclase (GGDEF)-like protein
MPGEDPEWESFLQATALAMLEVADEGFIVFDAEGCCRMIGRRAGEIFGVEPAAYVGLPREQVLGALSRACEEADGFLEAVAADAPLGVPAHVEQVDVRRPRPRTVVCKGVPISRDGRPPGRLILVRDVTRERGAERSAAQFKARLEELTPFDPLTGLFNTRRFREELDREHGRSSRAWDSYAVLRLDLDGMAAINEESGTPVGDLVLERLAGLLKPCVREYDMLARVTGDEFAVLLPGADALAARTVAERMLRAVSSASFDELQPPRVVTMCAGAVLWTPPSGESGPDIMRRAGEVLDRARARGPGTLEVDETPHTEAT